MTMVKLCSRSNTKQPPLLWNVKDKIYFGQEKNIPYKKVGEEE